MKRSSSLNSSDSQPPIKRFKTLFIDKTRRRKKFQVGSPVMRIKMPKYTTRYWSKRDSAVSRIVKFWNKYSQYIASNNTNDEGDLFYIRSRGKNVICPISQDKIPISKCIKFVSSTGHVHAYNVDDLSQYFQSSGNFTCPCTREEFSKSLVHNMTKKCSMSEGASLKASFEMRYTIRNRQRERDNRVLAIENSCGIAMTESLDMCSNLDVSTAAAAHQLLNYLIPEWKQLVNDFRLVSKDDCIAMLVGDREKIIRMERTGFKDEHQLVHLIKKAVLDKLTQFQNERNPPAPFVFARSLLPSNRLTYLTSQRESVPSFLEDPTVMFNNITRRLEEALNDRNPPLTTLPTSLPSLAPNFTVGNSNNYPNPPAPTFNFTSPLPNFFGSESND